MSLLGNKLGDVQENSFDVYDNVTTVIEDSDYPQVLERIAQYITLCEEDGQTDIVGMIIEFCHYNCYSLDVIADVIKSDSGFKSYIKDFCETNYVLKVD